MRFVSYYCAKIKEVIYKLVNLKGAVYVIASCERALRIIEIIDTRFENVMVVKLGLHLRFIAYDPIQACLFIPHSLEIYAMTWREYKEIGQTNRLV